MPRRKRKIPELPISGRPATVQQYAELAGIHPVTVYQLIKSGGVTAQRVGGRLLIPEYVWQALVNKPKTPTPEPTTA
jgi:excisionase family DNA binding protein